MTKLPSKDEFLKYKGTKFILEQDSEEPIDLELTKVDEPKGSSSVMSYSLVFTAPEGCGVEQKIHKLKHKEMGEIEVFLSPFWESEDGLMLEAVFNFAGEA